MQQNFKRFKEYIVLNYAKQDDKKVQRKYFLTPSKKTQFFQILEFVNLIEFKPVIAKLRPFIQYGMVFDGINTLYYDEEKVSRFTQKEFNQVAFNHIIHFLLGSHCRLNKNSVNLAIYIKATTILLASHFHLIKMAPKYSQSKRLQYLRSYEKFSRCRNENFIFFEPVLGLSDYFLKEFANDRIHYKPELIYNVYANEDQIFKTDIGNVYEQIHYNIMHLTLERGLGKEIYKKESIVMLKNKDGEFERAYKSKKDSKELVSIKEMYDTMMGKELSF